jgi:hypothetical protein
MDSAYRALADSIASLRYGAVTDFPSSIYCVIADMFRHALRHHQVIHSLEQCITAVHLQYFVIFYKKYLLDIGRSQVETYRQ